MIFNLKNRYPQFSKRLKELISIHGLNQVKFAKLIGISNNSATNYLSKGRIPEPDILVKIAVCFQTSVDWLLKDLTDHLTKGEAYKTESIENSQVLIISPGLRMARRFMERFPGEELDDEGMRKLATFFQKLYEARSKDLESQILNEIPSDIVDLAKGK